LPKETRFRHDHHYTSSGTLNFDNELRTKRERERAASRYSADEQVS